MTWEAVLPWATTIAGAGVMALAGKQKTRRAAWVLGLFNQAFWIAYAVIAGAWGFIAGSMIYAAVYTRNLLRGE